MWTAFNHINEFRVIFDKLFYLFNGIGFIRAKSLLRFHITNVAIFNSKYDDKWTSPPQIVILQIYDAIDAEK